MGFDAERTLYHGSAGGQEIDAFNLDRAGSNAGSPRERAIWFWDDPSHADRFVYDDNGGAVYPALARGKLKTIEMDGYNSNRMAREIAEAKAGGYDGLRVRGMDERDHLRKIEGGQPPDQIAVFDPSNIRSPHAAFDPAKSDSANLLAANHPKAAPAGLLGMGEGDNSEPTYADVLRGRLLQMGAFPNRLATHGLAHPTCYPMSATL